MAMLRSLGCSSLTRLPAISISPPVTDLKPGDHAQQGGFAAARRPEQNHEAAVLNGEVDAMDDFDVAIFLDDVFQCYRCHVIPSSLRITREKFVEQACVIRQIEE